MLKVRKMQIQPKNTFFMTQENSKISPNVMVVSTSIINHAFVKTRL